MPPSDDYIQRPLGARAAIDAYQAAAWRAPAATRFDSRPANDFAANDFLSRAQTIAPQATPTPVQMEPMPRWLIVSVGGVIAAVMGALLGGALAVY